MSLFKQQPSFPGTETNDNKKTIIIAGVAIFGVAIIAALIAGIFAPTAQKAPATQRQGASGTQVSNGASPLPGTDETPVEAGVTGAVANPRPTGNPLVPSIPTPEYQYIPEPTIDIEKLLPTTPTTPTPTPLPGPFYTPNGKQNDLTIRLYRRLDWDLLDEVQVINNKTREVRIVGYTYDAAPGDSAYFSRDFSQVIFLGGSKTEYQQLTVYSIPLKRNVKAITLEQMKRVIPSLQINKTSTLSRMALSPDGKKAAFSYGNTFAVELIEPNTYMIVVDLGTEKMQLLPVRGLVNGWKDATTIEYTVTTSFADPPVNEVREVKTTLP